MDETKKPNAEEMLDTPKLRNIDKQTAGFRAAAAAADMRTDDDKQKEALAEEVLAQYRKRAGIGGDPKHIKDVLNSCHSGSKEHAYPELTKGKLLFQTEEYSQPKEYITLQMNENKELVKKILDQRGCLTGHPEILCEKTEWDLPKLDAIQDAILKEFPDGKILAEKTVDITNRISKLLGDVPVSFDRSTHKVIVRSVRTKFDIREVNKAVDALSQIVTLKEAERIVAKEIAKKIQSVL